MLVLVVPGELHQILKASVSAALRFIGNGQIHRHDRRFLATIRTDFACIENDELGYDLPGVMVWTEGKP
jgi:hypothetical protein